MKITVFCHQGYLWLRKKDAPLKRAKDLCQIQIILKNGHYGVYNFGEWHRGPENTYYSLQHNQLNRFDK